MCVNHHKRKQVVLFNPLIQQMFTKYLLVVRTALGPGTGVFNTEPVSSQNFDSEVIFMVKYY